MTGLARTIKTVETTARILRDLTELSRRVGGPAAERSCASAVVEAERRLAYLRALSVRAGERALNGQRPGPAPAEPSLRKARPPRAPLSRREWEVALLIARGYTNQQIASELVLTPGTVANHVAHILTKLDLQSRTQVAVWLIRQEPEYGPA